MQKSRIMQDKFYEVSLLKSPLQPLTYKSSKELKQGAIVSVQLQNRKKLVDAVVLKNVEEPSFKCNEIEDIKECFYDEHMLNIAKFISSYYVCTIGEALSVYTPFLRTPQIKEEKFDTSIVLSPLQQEALEFLETKKQALLFANTGSGKSEIYIKAIEKELNRGNQAVMLMPEISLTPQMQKRLEKAFGKTVAIWHSKITKAKKEQIVDGLHNGDIRLIAGARSALFLPYSRLSLIVVDEEHDNSYKSEQKPRVNVKDVAIYIAKKQNIRLVLGSATPSISSFHKLPYIRVKKTYFDSSKSIIFDDNTACLSPKILNSITKVLEEKKQVIVFVPTRANYKYQICSSCGKSVECPYCSVSMSLHKNSLALKCHYCGFAQKIPEFCPSCKVGVVKNFRVGTAQIQEELQTLYALNRVERFDKDSVNTSTKLNKILKDFNDEKIDILVGTQMLSKGHDYHNVKLAVVLGIDSVLNMNSYKAREEALSLLIQISGRSGRAGAGEVIVQSKNEEFFKHYLEQSDYEEFLSDELEFRSELYPPFVKLAKVIFAHTNGIKANEEMKKYVEICKSFKDVQLVGFGECGVFKIASKYRYEILLRSNNIKALLELLHSINSPFATIDMDFVK